MTSREDILAGLRNEFVESTRARLQSMTELIERLTSRLDPEVLDELARHFHSLAGLGGTYGFPAITSLSRRAEELCEQSSPEPDTRENLRSIISKLTGEIENHPDSE